MADKQKKAYVGDVKLNKSFRASLRKLILFTPYILVNSADIGRARRHIYALLFDTFSDENKKVGQLNVVDPSRGRFYVKISSENAFMDVIKESNDDKMCSNFNALIEKIVQDVANDTENKNIDKGKGSFSYYIISLPKESWDDPSVQYHLINNYEKIRSSSVKIIFLSPDGYLPCVLERIIPSLKFGLPTQEELQEEIIKEVNFWETRSFDKASAFVNNILDADTIRLSAEACGGLTVEEARTSLFSSVTDILKTKAWKEVRDADKDEKKIKKLLTPEVVKATRKELLVKINQSKQHIVERSDVLEFVTFDGDLDRIGGCDALKKWIKRRKRVFTDMDFVRKHGISPQKGILCVGIPGTGKSLAAKIAANAWGIPTIKLDIGKVFNKFVGESEQRVRAAIETIEAIGKCVLWIDEFEKATSGMRSSGLTDSGVTDRVMSTILTWMNDKTSNVVIIATCNDISKIPPEFLRKGRFNEIFFFDIPTMNERKEIFKIHLKLHVFQANKDKTFNDYDLEALAAATPDFTGSEIEAIVEDAVMNAADERENAPTTEDILQAASVTKPLARGQNQQMSMLRQWAAETTRPVSTDESSVKCMIAKPCGHTICPYDGLPRKMSVEALKGTAVIDIEKLKELKNNGFGPTPPSVEGNNNNQ